jgi:aminoglycoside phosphotransferase (APT) family kinase protein
MGSLDSSPVLVPPHILAYLKDKLRTQDPVNSLSPAKSAQQVVLIAKLNSTAVNDDATWTTALQVGESNVVIRIWKGTSRWWTLNRHDERDLVAMARSEVAGYRVARQALTDTGVYVPSLLYFSLDDQHADDRPWAIMEYVGEYSKRLYNGRFDSSWKDGMIKIREEFGYAEAHPRWGRVPVERALDYALMVLHSLTIPLHMAFWNQRQTSDLEYQAINHLSGHQTGYGYTYQRLVELYQMALNEIQKQPPIQSLQGYIHMLKQAIAELDSYRVDNLQPVLVHIDLQPQNIFFHETKIRTVLDWEEAAYADPRFELLMLCRKVCSNRQQAECIWATYQQAFEGKYELGSLSAWLQLESTHSLTTLLLQSMNLAGGGRSPWETRTEMEGKIDRELSRLAQEGISFDDLNGYKS